MPNCLIKMRSLTTGDGSETIPATFKPVHCHAGLLSLHVYPVDFDGTGQPSPCALEIDLTGQQWAEFVAEVNAFVNPVPCLT